MEDGKLLEVDNFKVTTAIRKLRGLKKRTRVIPGGTSAGKTFGILPILIDTAAKTPNLEISVVSESVPHLRKGALKDFLKIMRATGRYNNKNYNKSLLTYYFANGSYIEFFSADQEDKVRGPRRNILYINECNSISFDTYHQLAIRTDQIIWLDFNPSAEFWAHTELPAGEKIEWLTLTYKDNEALSPDLVAEIEVGRDKAFFNPNLPVTRLFDEFNIKNRYWANWWKVYGLGMVGSLEGVIFSNWDTIDEIPEDARLLGYTMDFGYTNDPFALIAIYRWRGKLIYKELVYKKKMTNHMIAETMKNLGIRRTDLIVADCAEPKSIDEINAYGFRVRPAEKGPDSINFGIALMQEDEFLVTKDSLNLIEELRHYMWDTDKEGNALNKPIDKWNHGIDAIRYYVGKFLGKKNKRKGIRRRN